MKLEIVKFHDLHALVAGERNDPTESEGSGRRKMAEEKLKKRLTHAPDT